MSMASVGASPLKPLGCNKQINGTVVDDMLEVQCVGEHEPWDNEQYQAPRLIDQGIDRVARGYETSLLDSPNTPSIT